MKWSRQDATAWLLNALPTSDRPACWLSHVPRLPVHCTKISKTHPQLARQISYLIAVKNLTQFSLPPACVGSRTLTAAAGFRKAGVCLTLLAFKWSVWKLQKIIQHIKESQSSHRLHEIKRKKKSKGIPACSPKELCFSTFYACMYHIWNRIDMLGENGS